MLAKCFLRIIAFAVISFLVCIIGVLVAYFTQGSGTASLLFESYIFRFDGVLIVGFGYGLLWFIKGSGQQAFNSLFNILDISKESQLSLLKYHKWVTSSKRNHLVSAIVTVIGGIILWKCGYPLTGFSKYFLAVTSISLFYVAGLMSGYFIGAILIFRKLDEIGGKVKIKSGSSPYEIENLNMNLLICSTVGIIALFLAFRGTITANYTYADNGAFFRNLLIYPIVCFLPGILFVNFYCRYVLRKIQENEILQKIDSLQSLSKAEIKKTDNNKEKLEMEKLFIEIKEKLLAEKGKIPLLSLKDSPALFISVVFIMEFAIKNDKAINGFFTNLIN